MFGFIFSSLAYSDQSLNGDEENKVQEKGILLIDEYGKDSEEVEQYLQKKNLNPEDLEATEVDKWVKYTH